MKVFSELLAFMHDDTQTGLRLLSCVINLCHVAQLSSTLKELQTNPIYQFLLLVCHNSRSSVFSLLVSPVRRHIECVCLGASQCKVSALSFLLSDRLWWVLILYHTVVLHPLYGKKAIPLLDKPDLSTWYAKVLLWDGVARLYRGHMVIDVSVLQTEWSWRHMVLPFLCPCPGSLGDKPPPVDGRLSPLVAGENLTGLDLIFNHFIIKWQVLLIMPSSPI